MRKACTVRGVNYVTQPEVREGNCKGCAGDAEFDASASVCDELPTGCSDGNFIWIKEVKDGEV